MATIIGNRSVGDMTMDAGDGLVVVGAFVDSDSFVVPAPGLAVPAGTEVRVEERGYARCPCCHEQQAHLRGAGCGVIECRASGHFYGYLTGPGQPALTRDPGGV